MRAGRVLLLLGLALASVPAARGQPVPLDDGRPGRKKPRVEGGREALVARAATLTQQANALYKQGRVAQAVPLAEQALALYRRLYPPEEYPDGHPQLATTLNNLGYLHQARGELARAEPFYRDALAMQQRLTEALLAGSSEAEGLNYLAQLPLTGDSYLSLTRDLPGTDIAAHAAAWQGKGTLARWLAQRRIALARAGDPQAAALARARAELAALLLAPDAADRGRRLKELSGRKEKLEQDLARRLPEFARALAAARRTPDELRRALPEGAAFIDLLRYVRFEHDPERPRREGQTLTASYLAFVVTGAGVRRVELGKAAPIEAAVTAWRRELAGEGRRAITAGKTRPLPPGEAPERTVRRLVWQPLAKRLPAGTRTVWLAPDGALTGVPWAALPGSKPGTILLEEHALALVPHGGVLLEGLRDRKRPSAGGRLLTLGDVTYEAGGRPKPAEGAAQLSWPALPATAKEQQRVAALATEVGVKALKTLSGEDAKPPALLKELAGVRWAHLATHGFFADPSLRSALRLDEKDYERARWGERVGVGARSPLVLSGLVLSGSEVLTAEAIAGASLDNLELAVLSACDTGLGEVADGEGVLGLQRAFHIAGAKNVVASLWKVDDEATAALMSLFYYNLWREKLSPLEALRRAQLTLYRDPTRIPALARERGPEFAKAARLPAAPAGGERAHPRLWAGFVLSGPGR